MSREVSSSTSRSYGVLRVTRVWGESRATVYRHRRCDAPCRRRRPGPVGPMPDAALALVGQLADPAGAVATGARPVFDPTLLARDATVIGFPQGGDYDTDRTVIRGWSPPPDPAIPSATAGRAAASPAAAAVWNWEMTTEVSCSMVSTLAAE